jgi:hypothetical protein
MTGNGKCKGIINISEHKITMHLVDSRQSCKVTIILRLLLYHRHYAIVLYEYIMLLFYHGHYAITLFKYITQLSHNYVYDSQLEC